jgi:hypothetical protein
VGHRRPGRCGALGRPTDFGLGPVEVTGGPSSAYLDGFIAKYGPDGAPRWVVKVSGSDGEIVTAVATSLDGSVFVTGYFVSPSMSIGTVTLSCSDLTGAFVAKLDANGNVACAVQPASDVQPLKLAVSPTNGDVAVLGYGDAGDGQGNYLAVVGGDGTPRWSHSFGSGGDPT